MICYSIHKDTCYCYAASMSILSCCVFKQKSTVLVFLVIHYFSHLAYISCEYVDLNIFIIVVISSVFAKIFKKVYS